MKKVLTVIAIVSSSLSLMAQKETFDIASFVPPKGWQRIDTNGIVFFQDSRTHGGLTSFCQIFLYQSIASQDEPMQNFESEWQSKVARPSGVNTKPNVNSDKTADGWTNVVGTTNVTKQGITYTVILSAISGHGREMSILVNVAGQDYMDDIQVFFTNLDMRAPAVTGFLNSKDTPPESRQGTMDDYVFELPQGWAGGRLTDGAIMLSSPVSNTGEKCTMILWPMRPAGADLMKDAQNVFMDVFRAYQVAQAYTQGSVIRAMSPLGWEYVIIKSPIQLRNPQAGVVFGFVFVAKLGNQLAIINGISKDPLVSSCFGLNLTNVWPKFFYSLRFKNWPADKAGGLTKQLPGVWMAATATAGDRFAFAANGRFAGASAAQRYYAISSTELVSETDAYFGDGAWSSNGYSITLTKDSNKASPEKAWARIEYESIDGGATWKEKLYLLRRSIVDGSDYELAYEKQGK